MEKRTAYAAPNLMNICVDRKNGKDIVGRIYFGAEEAPVYFSSAGYMILEIDRICDRIGYPQRSVVSRSFTEMGTEDRVKEEVIGMKKSEKILSSKGGEATFVLHVKYRQNATWQGTVTWAEENIKRDFRSALELLKLIDSALDEKEQKEMDASKADA